MSPEGVLLRLYCVDESGIFLSPRFWFGRVKVGPEILRVQHSLRCCCCFWSGTTLSAMRPWRLRTTWVFSLHILRLCPSACTASIKGPSVSNRICVCYYFSLCPGLCRVHLQKAQREHILVPTDWHTHLHIFHLTKRTGFGSYLDSGKTKESDQDPLESSPLGWPTILICPELSWFKHWKCDPSSHTFWTCNTNSFNKRSQVQVGNQLMQPEGSGKDRLEGASWRLHWVGGWRWKRRGHWRPREKDVRKYRDMRGGERP